MPVHFFSPFLYPTAWFPMVLHVRTSKIISVLVSNNGVWSLNSPEVT